MGRGPRGSNSRHNRLRPRPRGRARGRCAPVRPRWGQHPVVTRVSRDQTRTLENLHSNFARMIASTFSRAQQSVVDCDIAFVDQTTYAEFIASLSNPSVSYTFAIEPLHGKICVPSSQSSTIQRLKCPVPLPTSKDHAVPFTAPLVVDRTAGHRMSVEPFAVGVVRRDDARALLDVEVGDAVRDGVSVLPVLADQTAVLL